MTTNEKYALIAVGVIVVGYAGYKYYQSKHISTAVKVAVDSAAFDISSFLNGNWTWEAFNASDNSQLEHDEMIIKGNDVYWVAKSTTTPEFTITSKNYDDATGKLLMSYKRISNDEHWDDILTVNKAAKTLVGTQNDGAIKLKYTKTA